MTVIENADGGASTRSGVRPPASLPVAEPDAVAFREAACRAVPLAGRGNPSVVDQAALPRAGRILGRWQAQSPFDTDDWFARRLAVDGLDPDKLRLLLAEPTAALADRLGADADWADWLVNCYRHAAEPPDIPAEYEFATLAWPMLATVRAELRAGFERLKLAELGSPDGLLAFFLPELFGTVNALVTRTLVLELKVASLTGTLTADTPEGRYRQFVERACTPAAAIGLFTEYPVLAQQLVRVARDWVRNNLLLVERLVADLPLIREAFTAGAALGELTEIRLGMGDAHRGGRTVAQLSFADGLQLMYKPRPIAVEAHFQDLVRALNPRLTEPLLTVTCLPRDGYGWMRKVTARHCADLTELSRFYRRSGGLLALLYLLNATDCHAQNFIAVGDQPVIVDLETVFEPLLRQPPKQLSVSEQQARTDANESVLRSGMLPSRSWVEEDNAGVDLSALAYQPDQLPPRAIPEVVDAGTDMMRIEYRRRAVGGDASRPVPPSHPVRLADFTDDIDAGFSEMYDVLLTQRELVRELVLAFAQDEVRLLRRDTFEYRSLLRSSFHPDVLRDALDRDRHFDRLWGLAAFDEQAQSFFAHEHADLWAGDIPVFTIRPDSVDAISSRGELIPDAVEQPSLQTVLAKLNRLGPTDLRRQRWLVRAATSSTSDQVDRLTAQVVSRPLPAHAPDWPALRARALEKAVELGGYLRSLAYEGPRDLAWVGAALTPSSVWKLGSLGPDLYSGTAGVALFYDRLAQQTRDREHLAIARAVRATLTIQIRQRSEQLRGGLSGVGGILYALAHAQAIRPDSELTTLVSSLLDDAHAVIAADDDYDLIGGCAGTIAGLLAWHRVAPAERTRDLVRVCADRLAAGKAEQEHGVGWLPSTLAAVADRPLAGFAHGASGIAFALTGAAALLGDERYAEPAEAALDYENTLFDEKALNWRDVRNGYDDEAAFPILWCHGATGIGMARRALMDVRPSQRLATDLDAAVGTVVRSGFGRNFSLCHGDLGNLDLLLLCPERGEKVATDATRRCTVGVLDALDDRGWVCGLPAGTENPSLMVGLAGIGYGLLRIAAQDRVPSVLSLQVPGDDPGVTG